MSQISDSSSISNTIYPFDKSSTLEISNHIFPYDFINDIFIMIRDESVPLYISRIIARPVKNRVYYYESDSTIYSNSLVFQQKDLGVLSVFISDGTGTETAFFQLSRQTSTTAAVIKTMRGTLCGGIKLKDNSLYSWLYSMTKNTLYGELTLSPDALILHPNTLACVSYSGYQGLSLNGQYLGNHIHLAFQHNLKVASDSSDNNCIQIDAFSNYDDSFQKTKKLKIINGVDLSGKAVVIKPNTLGDLRVITQNNTISLMGVTDI